MNRLAILTANIESGGIGRSRTEKRLPRILELLRQQRADVICMQECLYWDDDYGARFHMAEQVLNMRGYLAVHSTGMHTAIFLAPPLAFVEARTVTGGLWRHGAVWAQVLLPNEQFLEIGSAHLSSNSGQQRLLEAEQITTWWHPNTLSVVAGDMNVPGEDLDLTGMPPALQARFAMDDSNAPDTRPAKHLERAGYIDLGARPEQEIFMTAGHGRDVETRSDRIFASRQAAQHAGPVQRIETVGASDHHWLTVEFTDIY